MTEIKEGQVYTFDDGKTYYIINHIEDDNDIWYQIWVNDKHSIWAKLYPNEIVFIDVDFVSKYEFEEMFKKTGKYLGLINKDYGLNNNWNLVEKEKATKLWFKMTDIG